MFRNKLYSSPPIGQRSDMKSYVTNPPISCIGAYLPPQYGDFSGDIVSTPSHGDQAPPLNFKVFLLFMKRMLCSTSVKLG